MAFIILVGISEHANIAACHSFPISQQTLILMTIIVQYDIHITPYLNIKIFIIMYKQLLVLSTLKIN